MRVVLDTVVFVRALINAHGPWGRLLFDLNHKYTIVLSPAIVREILDVISRPRMRAKFSSSSDLRIDAVFGILRDAEVIDPTARVTICRDPKDNKFLECALTGQAHYLVSEDRDLLDLRDFGGIRIVTAADFISIIDDAVDEQLDFPPSP